MNVQDTSNWADWRLSLKKFVESSPVQRLVIVLILVSAALLGLETSDAVVNSWGKWVYLFDRIIVAVFVVEITLRLLVYRAQFFRDPWSVFDFLVVSIALIPASGPLEVLRSLRVLRVLRLLTMVPSMRRVVGGMLAAIPGLGSVVAVMLVIYYVSAVMATNLFGDEFPEWFGSLGDSAYTLFQIMTLESWSMGIVRPVMEVFPYAWVFFVPFILIATFTMLNLFIAVIVNAVQEVQQGESKPAKAVIIDADSAAIQAHIFKMEEDMAQLKRLLNQRT